MRLATFQMRSVAADVAANMKSLEKAAFNAADRGASLLVTPELALQGYGAGAALGDLAVTADSEVFEKLKALSIKSGIALVLGFAEREGRTIYNSAAYINGENTPVIYRKSHLYGDYERSYFAASPPLTVLFEQEGLKIGMLICYDVEFPENVRRLAKAGADLVVVPTALPQGEFGPFIAQQIIPVRAFENQVFVAYTNHCGNDGLFGYMGLSCIAAPDGSLLAAAEAAEEELLITEIDPSKFAASRDQNSYLKDLGVL